MNTIIALDIGGTTIDSIEFDTENQKIIYKNSLESKNYPKKNLQEIIKALGIEEKILQRKKIRITGASALNLPQTIEIKGEKIFLQKILEFESIAAGGKFLSKKNSGLVISLGTGTAMVSFKNENWEHVKGTGIGGGTFLALGEAILQTRSFTELSTLVEKGESKNIDLSVGDIAGGDLGILSADTTASNFAKYSKNSAKEDIALGIANLVAQSIASLAIEKAKRLGHSNIIVGGKLSRLKFLITQMEKTAKFFDMKIFCPPDADFMTTIGACIIE